MKLSFFYQGGKKESSAQKTLSSLYVLKSLFSKTLNEISITLGYTCDQMFDVVSEVQNYHRFVPWCKKSNVIFSDEESLDADLVIGFPPLFGESYKVTRK